MKLLIVLFSTMTLIGCCNCDYDVLDYELSASEATFVLPMSINDTITFTNELGKTESYTINFEREDKKECGCFAAIPAHMSFDIFIQSINNSEQKQNLLSITKYPQDKVMEGYINFHSFRHKFNRIQNLQSDTIGILDMKITNYYLFQSDNVNSDIKEIIWTERDGLVAYGSEKDGYFVRSRE